MIGVKELLREVPDSFVMDRRYLDHAARNVPRYTSYPTAPHFTPAVDGAAYADWLQDTHADAAISLYLHIPFCRTICHYCGCHTKAVRRDEPVAAYASVLRRELDIVLRHLGTGRRLVHVHWGGGTPSVLGESDFLGLVDHIRDGFACSERMEHAMELDPRTVTPRLVQSLIRAGVDRVNLGVQDLNPEVQLAIGRWQPYECVAQAVSLLRDAGLSSIGFDLMYGLPGQGEREIVLTAARAAALWPDRLAVFGYAHVPWMKRHQRRIDAAALPGTAARIEHAEVFARVLRGAGYRRIGIDHFALPGDALAVAARERTLRRNFQGYTADPADVLIGVGASAIGRLPQGFVQNAVDDAGWRRHIAAGRLPTARGRRLETDDLVRADVIEQLMCFFDADLDAVCARRGVDRDSLADSREALDRLSRDGLVRVSGANIRIPPPARPLTRVVAAAFDAYLSAEAARHSSAV